MRRIVGAAFLSLDGVIQGPGGPSEDPTGAFEYSGWLPPVGDESINDKIGELFGRPFDLLLGRRTYEIFAAYWPYASDEMADIRDPFNACTKYVVTHRDEPLEWENSERVSTVESLRAIKQGDGPDLVIQGSSTLYPQLLDAGLLDELTLMIVPIVLGSDRPPQGFGEVVLAPVAPAVAQAILHATDRCLDVMPFPQSAFRVAERADDPAPAR